MLVSKLHDRFEWRTGKQQRTGKMRLQGRLSDWDDKRGVGFIQPNGGGEKARLHISAYAQPPKTRPANGDLLSYQVITNPKGRPTASAVRPARRNARARTSPSRASIGSGSQRWRVMLALFAAGALIGAGASGLLAWPLAVDCGLASACAWFAYGKDKRAAQRGQRRTPEASLHLLSLLGGWPGALIAQAQFRHKTAKASFQAVFWVCVVFNLLALATAPRLLHQLAG